jgi:predicted RNA-binding Zn-ribbon protein involved in translation (DUF1610 family)
MTRHITRTTFSDGSVIAELYIRTEEPCPHCGTGGSWVSPRGDYRVCTSCRRGFELEGRTHQAADNTALEQVVEQLARVG